MDAASAPLKFSLAGVIPDDLLDATLLEPLNRSSCPARVHVAASDGRYLLCYSAALRLAKDVVEPDPRNYYEFLHKRRDERIPDLHYSLRDLRDDWRCGVAIFMNAGGYFAGAIYTVSKASGGLVQLKHKGFRRYVTRKGQGGRESKHRSKKGTGKSRSAGGRLRAFNETKHKDEILQLLRDWKEALTGVSRIFLVAPSSNRDSFFQDGSPLSANDERLRKVPLTTKRPSNAEVERIAQTLSSVVVVASTDDVGESDDVNGDDDDGDADDAAGDSDEDGSSGDSRDHGENE